MTLNGVLAIILRYFTQLGSFRGRLLQRGWRQIILSAIKSSSKNLVLAISFYGDIALLSLGSYIVGGSQLVTVLFIITLMTMQHEILTTPIN